MTNETTNILQIEQEIEKVHTFIYLGNSVNITKENQYLEEEIRLSWMAYGKLKSRLNGKITNITLKLKFKLYNELILLPTAPKLRFFILE